MSPPDHALSTDEELLNLWFEGESLAFNHFFNRHSAKVCAYGLKRGVPRNDIDDVVQEVFLRLHKSIHNYEKGRAALPWFFTIVHNTCMDWLRKNISSLNKNISLQEELIPIENETIDEEKLCEVNLVLNGLKVQEKDLFEMRNIEELSFKEISEKIGKSEVSLRKAYQRILSSIKGILSQKK